jgi:hypothetical protein
MRLWPLSFVYFRTLVVFYFALFIAFYSAMQATQQPLRATHERRWPITVKSRLVA